VIKHRALRGARAVIVPSQRTARELRLLHGVQATVVRGCLPSALIEREHDPATVLPAERRANSVLSVCRLEPVKRIDLLLRAFAAVRREVADATLTVAGTGSDEQRLRALAAEMNLGDDAVTFAGYVAERDLWRHYASAKVLAAPAMADFIIAPYEAMAMGARVVWTTEMETDPAIDGSGQVFVAPPEEAAFAAAIVRALRSGGAPRADLRAMTWEARGARVDALITRVLEKAA
jgi:glycosyltransferase involved in cell wall biosynthesis